MVVKIMNEFKVIFSKINSYYKNRLRLGMSGYSQLFFYSFLFCYPSFSYAGPAGGVVVDGVGRIHNANTSYIHAE